MRPMRAVHIRITRVASENVYSEKTCSAELFEHEQHRQKAVLTDGEI